MSVRRILLVALLVSVGMVGSCLDERVVAPDEPLPPILAVDPPTVQLFRFARGHGVETDTVRISNIGEGTLGVVERVGGVDYLFGRKDWLETTIENDGETALLVLRPMYEEEEQSEADTAEIVLKARNSSDLKRVRVIARTLPGARFEFSVDPLTFAALPGEGAKEQFLTVRNGGNDTLEVHLPEILYEGADSGWLFRERFGGTDRAPGFRLEADPSEMPPGDAKAFLVFESDSADAVQAKPDTVEVLFHIGQPRLDVSTSTLSFTAVRGGGDPPSQQAFFRNSGDGGLEALGNVKAGDPEPAEALGWLEVSSLESQFQVAARTGELYAGSYTATLPIISDHGGTDSIVISLEVNGPILTPTPSNKVSFGLSAGGSTPPPPQTVAFTNTGAGTPEALGEITLEGPVPPVQWLSVTKVEREVVLTPTAASTSLGAGTYSTEVPVNSAYGGRDTLTVILGVSRGSDPPVLALSSDTVAFQGVAGDPSPSPQEVVISNAGGGTLGKISLGRISYSGAQRDWLEADTAGGIITLTAMSGSLPDGRHTATVPVSAAPGGERQIRVSFTLGDPILTALLTSVSFSSRVGGANPPGQSILLSNTGPGDFASLGTLTVGSPRYTGVGGWLILPTTPAGDRLSVSVTTGALGPDTYEASFPVYSTRGDTVSIKVTFTVTPNSDPAILVASPGLVRMDAVWKGEDPPIQEVVLSNGGGGTLGTPVGVKIDPPGWLTDSITPGGSVLTLQAETGSLPAGTYNASVLLSSSPGGTATVNVTFVIDLPVLTLGSNAASFSGEEGKTATPASLSVGLYNSGAGTFSDLKPISFGSTVYEGTEGWLDPPALAGEAVVLSADLSGLEVGTYRAWVPVNSATGGSGSIAVTLTVRPPPDAPVLALSAALSRFSALVEGGDPGPQEVLISNSGGGGSGALGELVLEPVRYVDGSGWLSAARTGDTVTLSPTLNPVAGPLTAGTYAAFVPVRSDSGGRDSVAVSFVVAPTGAPADLVASPPFVRSDAVLGGANPRSQTVLLFNGGSGSLGSLKVEPGYPSWLDPSESGGALTLDFDIAGLAAGSYSDSVEVSSTHGGNETVEVTLVVGQPVLTLASESATFNGREGESASPESILVPLSNTGAGTLEELGDISLGSTPSWLAGDTVGGAVKLSATIGSLAPALYAATVPVSSEWGGSGSIEVTLTVSRAGDPPVLALSADTVGFDAVLGPISPAPKKVSAYNSGGGSLTSLGDLDLGTISYGDGPEDWLDTSTLLGSILTLRPVTASWREPDTATATVEVESTGGGTRSVVVKVVVRAPKLTASALSLSFTGQEGGTPPRGDSVTFKNTGAGGGFVYLKPVTVDSVTYGVGASGWLTEPKVGQILADSTLRFRTIQTDIPAGGYSATVWVSSRYGGSQAIAVNLTVVRETDPPRMVLSSGSLRFNALVGGGDPRAQRVIASNAGGGSLGSVGVGSPAYGPGATGWLGASVTGDTVTVKAATGSLALGSYAATLPVSSGGGNANLAITLEVGTPRLTLTPRKVSPGDTVGGTGAQPDTVLLTNTGGGTLDSLGAVTFELPVYGDGAEGWLEPSLVLPDTLVLQTQTGTLAVGSYQAWVKVRSDHGGRDSVDVVFTVRRGNDPPRLMLSQDSLSFSAIRGPGQLPAQWVDAGNSGGGGTVALDSLWVGDIDYGEGPEGWVDAQPADSSVSVATKLAGIPDGTHRATIPIHSKYGGDHPLTVTLTMASPRLNLSTATVTFSDTVGSPNPLRTLVILSNLGAGDDNDLGVLRVGEITYPDGQPGWLTTVPAQTEVVSGFQVELVASAVGLPADTFHARVPVTSEWGGSDTVAVVFTTREPDRSFDLPSIELVRDTVIGGSAVRIPLAGDSVVVGPTPAGGTQLSLRLGVRNGARTRLTLSGLRVGVPTYTFGTGGWITGAFLNQTFASHDRPAELFVVIEPSNLTSGRYEAKLVIRTEGAGLETVKPREVRVILVVS